VTYSNYQYHICAHNRPVWQGTGAVSINPDPSTKQRTQLDGLLAATTTIRIIKDHHQMPPTLRMQLLVHNISESLLANLFVIPETAITGALQYNNTTYDVTAQLHDELTKNHFSIIASPQPISNSESPTLPTPRNHLQLVQDLVNRHSITSCSNPHECQVYSFPACRAELQSTIHSLSGIISISVKNANNGAILRKHIETKNHWPKQAWNLVDWDTHHKSIQQLPYSQ